MIIAGNICVQNMRLHASYSEIEKMNDNENRRERDEERNRMAQCACVSVVWKQVHSSSRNDEAFSFLLCNVCCHQMRYLCSNHFIHNCESLAVAIACHEATRISQIETK